MKDSPTMPVSTLSPDDIRDLRRLAGLMIPPSEVHAVPGADDEVIFADVLVSLGRDAGGVSRALQDLAALAGERFADLDYARCTDVIDAYCAAGGPGPALLVRVILQCYYRDDRVLRALNIEPRPPFPKGHVVEQGDWSLLDPVRRRPRLWRDAN